MAQYATATEFRNFTQVTVGDYSDDAANELLTRITNEIDFTTGRTWQSDETYSNELYDGNGTDLINLDRRGVTGLVAVEVDYNGDGTFTDETANCGFYDYGAVFFKQGTSEFLTQPVVGRVFPFGRKNVRVSYEAGTTTVPNEVKHLCLLMAENDLRADNFKRMRQERIERLLNKLSFKSVSTV